jgi:membrane-bound inhibitor of C-type lysozyme
MQRGTILFCLLLIACAGDYARHSESADHRDNQTDQRPLTTTQFYQCDDYRFAVRFDPDEIALWLADRYIVLSHVRNASQYCAQP